MNFMSREIALQQLQDIRTEILTVYAETEDCKKLQRKIETLKKEKENPTPPSVSLKPENTAGPMKESVLALNRERTLNSTAVTAGCSIAVLLGFFFRYRNKNQSYFDDSRTARTLLLSI